MINANLKWSKRGKLFFICFLNSHVCVCARARRWGFVLAVGPGGDADHRAGAADRRRAGVPRHGGEPLHLHANRCICMQTGVKLSCAGFDSSPTRVDPSIIRHDGGGGGDLCTLNGGGPVTNGRSVSFYYAGKTRVSFTPVSSTVSCSWSYDRSWAAAAWHRSIADE